MTRRIGPEEKKFQAWIDKEKKKGLIDIHCTPPTNKKDYSYETMEEFCKENNELNRQIDAGESIEDEKVF